MFLRYHTSKLNIIIRNKLQQHHIDWLNLTRLDSTQLTFIQKQRMYYSLFTFMTFLWEIQQCIRIVITVIVTNVIYFRCTEWRFISDRRCTKMDITMNFPQQLSYLEYHHCLNQTVHGVPSSPADRPPAVTNAAPTVLERSWSNIPGVIDPFLEVWMCICILYRRSKDLHRPLPKLDRILALETVVCDHSYIFYTSRPFRCLVRHQ